MQNKYLLNINNGVWLVKQKMSSSKAKKSLNPFDDDDVDVRDTSGMDKHETKKGDQEQ